MQWLESYLLDGGSCLDRSLCHLLCLDPSHALPCRWATLVRKYVCCLGVMVYTSILTVFLGVGSLLGYCSYNLYKIWPSDDPETNKNIFQVFFYPFLHFHCWILQLNWTPEIIDDFLKQKNTWLAFTSIVGILFLVVVCLFIFLWQRIRIAIALIEQVLIQLYLAFEGV